MFSLTSDYALRVVVLLASLPGKRGTISGISKAVRVNPPYLRKVVNKLRSAEIVEVRRGIRGGISLVSDPRDLTLLDVINATDPVRRIESCPVGFPEHLNLCSLHAELDEAIAHIEKLLGSRTIMEILANRKSADCCGFPGCEELLPL